MSAVLVLAVLAPPAGDWEANNVCALLTHAVGCNAHQLVQICRFYIVSMREMVTKMEQWAELPDEIKAMIV